MDYDRIITVDPAMRSGQPCVRGMRITVRDVLEYLAGGMSVEEVIEDFPELTPDDIRACLAFAASTESCDFNNDVRNARVACVLQVSV